MTTTTTPTLNPSAPKYVKLIHRGSSVGLSVTQSGAVLGGVSEVEKGSATVFEVVYNSPLCSTDANANEVRLRVRSDPTKYLRQTSIAGLDILFVGADSDEASKGSHSCYSVSTVDSIEAITARGLIYDFETQTSVDTVAETSPKVEGTTPPLVDPAETLAVIGASVTGGGTGASSTTGGSADLYASRRAASNNESTTGENSTKTTLSDNAVVGGKASSVDLYNVLNTPTRDEQSPNQTDTPPPSSATPPPSPPPASPPPPPSPIAEASSWLLPVLSVITGLVIVAIIYKIYRLSVKHGGLMNLLQGKSIVAPEATVAIASSPSTSKSASKSPAKSPAKTPDRKSSSKSPSKPTTKYTSFKPLKTSSAK
jgi:hypothetical protein